MRERIKTMGEGSQRDVAMKAGIAEATLSQLLGGRNKGSEFLPQVCEAMGLDMWEYMPLDTEQRRVLKALEAARRSGHGQEFTAEAEVRAKWFKDQPAVPAASPMPAPPSRRRSSDG
jgi:transcriptional regulator with XRE-family HTH domain